jgi:hypothetical protein
VCFRIHIGAIKPSGNKGEEGVKGDKGECAVALVGSSAGGWSFRGGNRTPLSTGRIWNVLDLSGDHIDGLRWERKDSRRRRVSRVNGSCCCDGD